MDAVPAGQLGRELQRWAERGRAEENSAPARGGLLPKPINGLAAEDLKFNLRAGVSVPAGLPSAREPLMSYCARPPLAHFTALTRDQAITDTVEVEHLRSATVAAHEQEQVTGEHLLSHAHVARRVESVHRDPARQPDHTSLPSRAANDSMRTPRMRSLPHSTTTSVSGAGSAATALPASARPFNPWPQVAAVHATTLACAAAPVTTVQGEDYRQRTRARDLDPSFSHCEARSMARSALLGATTRASPRSGQSQCRARIRLIADVTPAHCCPVATWRHTMRCSVGSVWPKRGDLCSTRALRSGANFGEW